MKCFAHSGAPPNALAWPGQITFLGRAAGSAGSAGSAASPTTADGEKKGSSCTGFSRLPKRRDAGERLLRLFVNVLVDEVPTFPTKLCHQCNFVTVT